MTLTELLLVLSLMSLTLLFLPASNEQLTQKNQRINLENQLTNIIQFSRNMAMAKGQNLAINSLSGDEYWSSGMVLFVDNPSHHYTVKDKLLRGKFISESFINDMSKMIELKESLLD